jgi:hypothetical protein
VGFEIESRYTLGWPEGSPFHGMEVVVTSMSIETLMRIDEIAMDIEAADASPEGRQRMYAATRERAKLLADHGIEWNLTRRGEPLSFDTDGVLALEKKQIVAIINGWIQAVTEVPDPLPDGSDDTPPFPEESIPMEVSTSSHAS